MPDLLLELFSEEIPARMQARAADDLKKMVTDRLVAAGLVYEGVAAFATPRRLALAVRGVPAKQPDVREERKGPRVGAPDNAITGFVKAAGLASIDQAKVVSDGKKGEFYVAVTEKPGRDAITVIGEIIPEVVRAFPWPKSMRWGAGNLTWVRPLHSIVATFGPETEEPEIVPFVVDGIAAGDVTRGHRFLAPGEIKVRRLDDYVTKLQAAKVVLDPARRADIILHEAKHLAFAQGYELLEDTGLLAEVSGLVEWPVVLMGSFDEAFLAIPPEVIRTTIRNNQKCFVLRRGAAPSFETRPAAAPQDEADHRPHPEEARSAVSKDGGKLANKFVLVANTEASDGGAAIVAGNERVIRARLSDAKFFYETDLKVKLEDRLEKLKEIVFHEKLGTQYERVERIEWLARELAPIVGAYPEKAARAARLAKADLVTEMVGEFPELQGLMGKYYALAQGEDPSVAAACEDHYKPLGPNDRVPTDPVSIVVALADKIDTLVGFWAIDEKPTGSKDPYALRRAALSLIRLIESCRIRIPLQQLLYSTISGFLTEGHLKEADDLTFFTDDHILDFRDIERVLRFERMGVPFGILRRSPTAISQWRTGKKHFEQSGTELKVVYNELSEACWPTIAILREGQFDRELFKKLAADWGEEKKWMSSFDELTHSRASIVRELMAFFADRLKVQLREQGARHDLVDAVFALEGQDDLLLIVRRVEALGQMLATDDGKNLLAGVKRATNIIRIEEKKDGRSYQGTPDPALYEQKEERDLAAAIAKARQDASAAVARENFSAAMQAIASLRPFVDAFFEKVTVNVPEAARRENRLKLLNEIREATGAVADFSKIEG